MPSTNKPLEINKNTFTKKLSSTEQEDILNNLFGFEFHNGILYDDDDEFYGCIHNKNVDFTTLKGIFDYAMKEAKKEGICDAQRKIRHSLGLP